MKGSGVSVEVEVDSCTKLQIDLSSSGVVTCQDLQNNVIQFFPSKKLRVYGALVEVYLAVWWLAKGVSLRLIDTVLQQPCNGPERARRHQLFKNLLAFKIFFHMLRLHLGIWFALCRTPKRQGCL